MTKLLQLSRLAVLSLAALGASAFAGPINISLQGSGDTWSAGLANVPGQSQVTHTSAGSFTDVFNFSFSGPALIDASISVSWFDFLPSTAISFDPADLLLNGHAMTLKSSQSLNGYTTQTYSIDPFVANGPFTLSITGIADPSGLDNDMVNASYTGLINVDANVPEPASLALAGVALAALAWSRRKKA